MFSTLLQGYQNAYRPAASVWFEILGVVDPGKKKFDFSRQISEKFRFFPTISQKLRFSRQKLAISSNVWANYSISPQKSPLSPQKSPLSNIFPVHDQI